MGGVLERYPDDICFAHGGGSFPATIGRIDHGFNVRPDLCQTRTQTPPSELLSSIYIDSVQEPDAPVRGQQAGRRPNCAGTDYPFPLGELAPGQLIESSHFSAADKERMLSGTALEFLGRHREDYETAASLAHSEWLRENS